MKKILLSLICFSLAIYPCFALDISDSFVEASLDNSLEIKPVVNKSITDTFAESNTMQNVSIKPAVLIEDKFAEANTNKSVKKVPVVINESIPKVVKADDRIRKAVFDYSIKEIAVPIRAVKLISTKNCPEEGDFVEFETTKDVVINNKTYSNGTKVLGRIETVSMNYSLGVPADLTVGNFRIGNELITTEIHRTGANRSLWVKPCSYVGLCFFGLGVLIMPIRGGHAKISPNETLTVYYRWV